MAAATHMWAHTIRTVVGRALSHRRCHTASPSVCLGATYLVPLTLLYFMVQYCSRVYCRTVTRVVVVRVRWSQCDHNTMRALPMMQRVTSPYLSSELYLYYSEY